MMANQSIGLKNITTCDNNKEMRTVIQIKIII